MDRWFIFYIEKSKLIIADLWLIPLDRITYSKFLTGTDGYDFYWSRKPINNFQKQGKINIYQNK